LNERICHSRGSEDTLTRPAYFQGVTIPQPRQDLRQWLVAAVADEPTAYVNNSREEEEEEGDQGTRGEKI